MAFNLEIKVSFPNMRRIYPRLKKLGAVYETTMRQTDTYYQSPAGLLKLRTDSNKQQLILYNRNENEKKRWSEYYILTIEDKSGPNFLKRLFPVEATVKKTRILYIYGNTRIHLDKVQGLGTFIELESVVKKDKNAATKEFALVKSALGLEMEKELRKSYRDLLLETKSK